MKLTYYCIYGMYHSSYVSVQNKEMHTLASNNIRFGAIHQDRI